MGNFQKILKPTRARALDTSGNNNHGQIYSGRALEFDGISDYLTFNPAKALDGFTVACWVNCNLTGDWNTILGHSDGFNDYVWFVIHNTGYIAAQLNKDNGSGSTIGYGTLKATDVIEANTWYRAVLTYNSTRAVMYLNGVQVEVESTTGPLDNDAGNMQVGANASGGYLFDGKMSDFQYWNASWTADDALYDYNNPEQLVLNNSGTSLTNSNLKVWYPMNDGHRGQQSYVLDASNTGIGDDIVTNGTFDSDTYWTLGDGWSIADGKASCDGSQSGYSALRNNADGADYTVINGGSYRVSFDWTRSSGTLQWKTTGSHKNITSGTSGSEDFYAQSDGTSWYITVTSDFVGSVDNIVVKPVNVKNHATTVFHGDMTDILEDDASSPGSNDFGNLYNTANTKFDFTSESAAFSGGDGYDIITNSAATSHNSASAKIETDNSSTGLEIYNSDSSIPICNFEGVTVVGRTYQVDVTCYADTESFIDVITSLTVGTAEAGNQYAGVQSSGGGTTITATFTSTQTAVFIGLGPFSITADKKVRIKTLQIREVGTASGWTDADQQLDIPQTALQSYNQLCWFQGAATGQYGTLDSQIATTTNNWSLSFWIFHFENNLNYDIPIGSATGGKYLALDNNGTRKLFFRDDAGTYHAISDAEIPQGKWVHIVVTALGDTSITAYVNGVAQDTNSSMSDTELIIDRIMAGYSTSNLQTRGSITEISYYGSYVLTQSHVDDLYNDGKAKSALDASSSAGVTHYWRDGGLTEWQDLKGSNDINLTNVTETMLITAGADSSRDSQGFLMNRQRTTNSLNLTDSTELEGMYVRVGENPDFRFSSGGSVAFWMKFRGTPGSAGYCVLNKGPGSSRNPRITLESSKKINLFWEIADGTNKNTIADDACVEDTWTYVTCTWDGTTNKIYYNDALNTSEAESGTPDTDTTTDLYIGHDDIKADGHFEGFIDDVVIYSDILTLAEVKRNYNAGKRSHR